VQVKTLVEAVPLRLQIPNVIGSISSGLCYEVVLAIIIIIIIDILPLLLLIIIIILLCLGMAHARSLNQPTRQGSMLLKPVPVTREQMPWAEDSFLATCGRDLSRRNRFNRFSLNR
jgi:hypothetical protein